MGQARFQYIADDLGLPGAFPREVDAEVDAYLAAPGTDDPALVDRTALPFVTIDGPGTRDLDQALHVEARQDGFQLRYAIADASYYVRPGTALFAEALRRGASYYLPGLSVPMLPRALSEGLVSLGPDVDRRALVFDVTFDPRGTVTAFVLERARIRSRAKLAFEEVQAFVDARSRPAPGPVGIGPVLRAAVALGTLRADHADRASMVRYRRVETSARLDADGTLVISSAPRTAVELANEQISILCNALGARYLLAGPPALVQPIYRVHEPPDEERVVAFAHLVSVVAAQRGLPDDPWLYRRAADLGLAGYLESLPSTGAAGRVARALHRQAMLLNGRSRFDAEPRGHFGVGEQVYSRFTAPMREIVGVQCHAQAIERMVGHSERSREEDEAIRAEVIEAGNRAKDLQRRIDREIDAQLVAAVLEPELARAFDDRPARSGTVTGFAPSKVHVLLDHPPIDVRAPLHAQGKQHGGAWLTIVDDGTRLARDKGATVCRLGDQVDVRAVARDAVVIVGANTDAVAPAAPLPDPITEISTDAPE
jgi:ribonuclease R